MQGKYLAVFTAMGCDYPEYVNFYQHGDEVEITVRDKRKPDGGEGAVSSLRFPCVLFDLMLEDIKKNYTRSK